MTRVDDAAQAAADALYARLREAILEWRDDPDPATDLVEHIVATFSTSEIDAILNEVAVAFDLTAAEEHAMRERVGQRYLATSERIGERLTPDKRREIRALLDRFEP